VPRFAPTTFRCELIREDGHVRVAPHGELDLSTVPILDRRLREALDSGVRRVLVDLRELEFMDSTALTLLVRWSRASADDGFDLALVRGDPRVHRLFTLTGLESVFAFAEE
jgi:anti-sigma B factor antagonist